VRAKVKSIDQLQEYLTQLRTEKALADGDEQARADVSVDGHVGNAPKGTVGITKRLFIPVPPTKEDGKQIVNDPIEKAKRFLDSTKARLVGPFSSAQPSCIMDGLFLIPQSKAQAYKEEIDAAAAKLILEYLPEIETGYEQAIEIARTAPLLRGGLGPLFDRGDYLSAEDFCAGFKIEMMPLKLEVPDNVERELREQFSAQLNAKFAAAEDEIGAALRQQAVDLFDHLRESLTPGEDGKPKKFHATAVENIRSFMANFADRNMFGDSDLSSIVEQARAVLGGVNVENIRKDGGVRDALAARVGEIKGQLDRLVTVQTSRKLDFSD